jgi:hypothetical protein
MEAERAVQPISWATFVWGQGDRLTRRQSVRQGSVDEDWNVLNHLVAE